MKRCAGLKTLVAGLALAVSAPVMASHQVTLGAWYNYANDDASNPGVGRDGAVILYMDGAAEEGQGNWSYSSELRVGPGSFTDTANNATGDEVSLHKAWFGYQFSGQYKLVVGKSQVPFGWKTTNFWPGDMFQAGYGDQMDVGLKLEARKDDFNYSLAYYHQDDWWATSTDTTDDNRHWGSSTSYRKVQTFVVDLNKEVVSGHIFGLGLQSGQLEDLTSERSAGDRIDSNSETDGDHSAGVVYYKGNFGPTFVNAEVIQTQRNLPQDLVNQDGVTKKHKSMRYALEIGRSAGDWTYYLDATWASSDTDGRSSDMIAAYAPGIRYDYGPGWIYAEYLTQDGYMDRDGDAVTDSDFNAFYLSVDWYY